MRISDWSSDVCSSDLTSRTVAPAFANAKAGAVADNTKGRIQITEFSMQAQHIIAAASAATGLSDFGDPAALDGLERLVKSSNEEEIGRASCRERVWKYV